MRVAIYRWRSRLRCARSGASRRPAPAVNMAWVSIRRSVSHWKLNNAQFFAKTFTFDELSADAIEIPSLISCARGLGYTHALLLACMHRLAHARARRSTLMETRCMEAVEGLTRRHPNDQRRPAVVIQIGADVSSRLVRSQDTLQPRGDPFKQICRSIGSTSGRPRDRVARPGICRLIPDIARKPGTTRTAQAPYGAKDQPAVLMPVGEGIPLSVLGSL